MRPLAAAVAATPPGDGAVIARAQIHHRSGTLAPAPRLDKRCACGSCAQCANQAVDAVPASVHATLRSGGHALDLATRDFFAARMGQDFSGVRVHTGALAAQSARDVQARAYTVGRELVFGAGQYDPHSARGRQLLAHELAHVAQPRASGAAALSQPGDASEREAERAAEVVAGGGSVRLTAAGAAIQRQPLPDATLDLPPLTGSDGLLENASPLLAAAVGSVTLDEFDTGKAELKPTHRKQLAGTLRNIQVLMRQYPLSTLTVTGYADTLDTDAKNLELGETRATVVKQALIDQGIAAAIIATDSKGEGPPQAVKTGDATPSARNRRVVVRFHPKKSGLPPLLPQLKPPTLGNRSAPSDAYSPPEKPPIDSTYRPDIFTPDDAPRPPFRRRQPDHPRPIPPPPKGSERTSALDVVGKKFIDPVVDAVAGWLPKSARDKIKDGARSAVKSGAAKGARAAAEAAGLTDPAGLDAIEKAAEAAIQEKGKSPP